MPFKQLKDREFPSRMIVSVEGERGSGKTNYSLSAAQSHGPVYAFTFDIASSEGTFRAAKKLGLDVNYEEYSIDFIREIGVASTDFIRKGDSRKLQEKAMEDGNAVLARFENDYRDAVATATRTGGTLALITGSELYELIRLAWYGKVSQVPELGYPSINAKFMHFVNLATSADCSLVVEHQLKEEYRGEGSDKHKTGRLIRAGSSKVEYSFPLILQMYRKGTRTDPSKEEGEQESSQFFVHVSKCNLNPELVGIDIQIDESLTGFDVIGQLVFDEEW